MKHLLLAPFALLLGLSSCCATDCCSNCDACDVAGVEWVDFGDDPMSNPAFMEAMAAAGTPGEEHAALAARTGTWSVVGNSWMAPGGDPIPMNGTAEVESLFGGRFIVEAMSSDIMGMPYEGQLIQGYDNVSERYWSMWVDNMNTGVWVQYGTEVEPGVFDFRGVGYDVFTPDGRPSHITVEMDGDDRYTMRMYDFREGTDEYLVMELVYARN